MVTVAGAEDKFWFDPNEVAEKSGIDADVELPELGADAWLEAEQPRHSKEDALDDREYQLLLEGAMAMEEYYGFQARFAILVMGRLGLRRGELAHLQEDWIDWRDNMIEIPSYEACTKGKEGGRCGYCRKQAKQEVRHNEDVTIREALAYRWHPKTEAAARKVPFDFDPRAHLVIERWFDKYDSWPLSCQAVNRRVERAAEEAEGLDPTTIYPHCLRATAASYHAGRGLPTIALQALMGWADVSTAKKYVQQSGKNTARQLHQIHNR